MTKKQLIPLTGVAAVGLIIAAFSVGGETPDGDAPLKEVVSFYTNHDSDQQLGAALLAYGALFLVLFAASLRKVLRRPSGEGADLAALGFTGASIAAVGIALFAGISFALGDFAKDIEPSAVQALNVLNEDLFFPLAIGTGLFMFGNGLSIVKSAALPKWLGWAGVVIGVAAVSPIGFFGFLAMGLWILVASVLLATRAEA